VFERAARENRFVLLDLEAVWCHWCHVMDEVTYSDPKVVELIESRYIPVRVDQDSRPDISRRYENYGWPTTVVFNAEGGEIVQRRGYLPGRYFFCSSSSFGMPNCPSSSCSLRMSIDPTMFTIVNSRGSLAMMARPLARSCSTRM
jgi:thioredoxin-related protein